MSNKSSAQKVIASYRKRQQMGPYIVGGLAIILVIIGVAALVIWLTGSNRPVLAFLASATPTSTNTATKTPVPPTATATLTSTITLTPTVTITDTPSGPQEYTVKDGDTCSTIASTYKVNLDVLIALNPNYGENCIIAAGDVLLIPLPDQVLPTDTPLPTGLAPGTKIQYTVKSGDSVRGLAIRFNSTIDSIVTTNKLANANAIQAGQVLTILVNIVTPIPTSTQTKTPGPGTVYPPTRTPTTAATASATATLAPSASPTK